MLKALVLITAAYTFLAPANLIPANGQKECGIMWNANSKPQYLWLGKSVTAPVFFEHVGRWYVAGQRIDCSEATE